MTTEQLRAEFEAHFSRPPFEWEFHRYGVDSAWPGNYQLYEHQCAWQAYQAGRAALQSQEPKGNDLMLSAVLRMPFEMAMASEISRLQFYKRAQQALDELEALQSRDREDADRLDWLREETCDLRCINVPTGGDDYDVRWVVIQHHMSKPHDREIGRSFTDDPRDAIDHARRIEGGGE